MRHLTGPILAAIISMAIFGPAKAAPPGPEPVEIATEKTKLKGFLYRPKGPGPFRPWSRCMTATASRGGAPTSRGAIATGASGSRPPASSCCSRTVLARAAWGRNATPASAAMRSGRDRVVDADAARHWLQEQSYVAADRVSLVGWANGGVAALWAVRPRTGMKDDKPDFRSAVAFYPGCRRLRDTAWSARMPTLILIGAKDDWSPASSLRADGGGRTRAFRAQPR